MCEATKCVKDAERVSKMKSKETSEVQEEAVTTDESEGEVWDIVCALVSNTEHKCMTDSCKKRAVATWSSNMKPKELWHTCEDHQELDFGGWPEDFDRPRTPEKDKDRDDESQGKDRKRQDSIKAGREEPREIVLDENENNKEPEESRSKNDDKETRPHNVCSNGDSTDINEKRKVDHISDVNEKAEMSKDGNDECEDDEQWDLSHVFTVEEMKSCKEPMCMTEDCPLIACCLWVSNKNPNEPWRTCLDCQENDFDGWPSSDEIPMKMMTNEHREFLIDNCTAQTSPKMPEGLTNCNGESKITPDTPSPSIKSSPKIEEDKACAVTPTPKKIITSDDTSQNKETKVNINASKLKTKLVTPTQNFNKASESKKPSKAALAIHRKWQEAAESMGSNRIIVSKVAAKQVIFDGMKDAFRPMNITEIYKASRNLVVSTLIFYFYHIMI